jgi:hypothetical protein
MRNIQDKEKHPDRIEKYFQRKNSNQDPFIQRRYFKSIQSQYKKQQSICGQTEKKDDMQSKQGEYERPVVRLISPLQVDPVVPLQKRDQ